MSFQSYAFLLLFLPVALALTAAVRRWAPGAVKPVLIGASVVFYASWVPATLPVFVASVAGNRAASAAFDRLTSPGARRCLLLAAIAGNLLLLIWFRYLFAWLLALDTWFGTGLGIAEPLAPLGISFFTFTQIGYLLDRHAGLEPHRVLVDQVLFVAFFPSQIAGPVLTAREMMPQFAALDRSGPTAEDLARGTGIFLIGLVKKTLLADPLLPVVNAGYADPAALGLFGAWQAALAYWLMLYLDFSAYSDMAVGLARVFGLRYPWNFASPYQARGVIEYWQRWHISLTRFFMATLHAPLTMAVLRWRRTHGFGVDRTAQGRVGGFLAMHALPLFVTMTLAGIWHGASLTFLAFGLLHAAFLAVNHAWRLMRPRPRPGHWRHGASVALTCLCVLVGSVFFRAPTLDAAGAMLAGMAGLHGLGPMGFGSVAPTARDVADALGLVLLLAFVWAAPNTRAVMDGEAWWSWRPNLGWAAASGAVLTMGLLSAGGTAEFLYARF